MSIVDLEVNAVLCKTESGHSAIKLRDRALTPKHRMLLIMVDGSKTVADLSNPMPLNRCGMSLRPGHAAHRTSSY